MNESINHEAVYRTAPATPGLLINDEAVYRTAPATPGLLIIPAKMVVPNPYG